MSLSLRARNVLKKALASNSAGNEIANIMGGSKQITKVKVIQSVQTEVKEISQLICPAVIGVDKEISQLICPAHTAAVREITALEAVAETGVREITAITAIAESSVKEITEIVAVAETGEREITSIACVADVAGSLDGKYFILYDDAGSVAFWIDIDNSGTVEPVHGADRSVEITTIATGELIGDVGAKVYAAIIADSKFMAGADAGGGSITVQSSTFGVKLDGSNGTSGFTIVQDTAGAPSVYDGKYFILQDNAGSVAFWFDVDNLGLTVEPSHGATRAVKIDTITGSMALAGAGGVGTAIYTAVVADAQFEAGADAGAGTVTVASATYGVKAASSDGTSPCTLTQDTPGVASNLDGTYFILEDEVGTVAFWFDVDNSGTAIPAGLAALTDRQIEITTIVSEDVIGTVGTAIYNAIIGDSKFEAGSDDAAGNLTIRNVYSKAVSGQDAGTSPLVVAESTPGVDSNYDGLYFMLYDNAGSVAFWFDADNRGTTIPSGASAADRAVEITTVTIGMTNIQAGSAIYTAITNDAAFEAGADGGDGTMTVRCVTYGVRTDGNAGDSPLTVAQSVAGVNETYDGLYIILQDVAGSVAFWFDVDNSGTAEPVHGADRSVEITTITTGMTAGQAGTAIYTAIIADSEFEAGSDDTAGTILVQNADAGVMPDVSAGTSFITASVNQQGSDNYSETYFLLYDDAGSVAFWFDIDNIGQTIPAGAALADRAIEVTTVNTGMTAGQVGTALYTKIIADAQFEAGSDDTAGTILVQSVTNGVKSDIDVGNSAITVSVDQQGLDAAIDGAVIILKDAAGTVAFWVDVDNAGTSEPAVAAAADRSIEITTVNSGMTILQAAAVIYTAIDNDSEFNGIQDSGNGELLIESADIIDGSGQSATKIDALQVADYQVGYEDGGSISDASAYILRVALARTSTDAYFLEIKSAIETGTGTSLSDEALRSLKIMLADYKSYNEIAALY